MDNKQTAVNWLFEQVDNLDWKHLQEEKKIEILDQAKAMEKEQIMKAYGQGIADEAGEILDATKDAQQYYNKTYTND